VPKVERYNLSSGHGQIREDGMDNGSGSNQGKHDKSDPHVQEVVKAAHEELRQLMRQRAEVMKRIGTVKQTIVGLANLFGDDVLNDELLELVDRKSGGRQPGFTKACRMVLMEADKPLGAREVCDQIQQRMPPILVRHKDPLASVTTVLNRLVEYGEARTVMRENGRRAWEWVSEPGQNEFTASRAAVTA
jgi:hypothetical protein